MIKKAMILAAGYGKRIQPLTLKYPKPLLNIGKETLLSNTISFLEKIGITTIIINVHYLGEQIIEYINEKKFNLNIKIVKEKDKILDTGGGVLNAIQNFSNEPFLVINPDTIWNLNYVQEVQFMKEKFFKNKQSKCFLLVVNKKKSFDKNLNGDFNIQDNLNSRKNPKDINYIYTGLQIVRPEVFLKSKEKIFSMNKVWDRLIKKNELFGLESNIEFLHVSTLAIYKNLIEKSLIK